MKPFHNPQKSEEEGWERMNLCSGPSSSQWVLEAAEADVQGRRGQRLEG